MTCHGNLNTIWHDGFLYKSPYNKKKMKRLNLYTHTYTFRHTYNELYLIHLYYKRKSYWYNKNNNNNNKNKDEDKKKTYLDKNFNMKKNKKIKQILNWKDEYYFNMLKDYGMKLRKI